MTWPPGERGGPTRTGTASPLTAADQSRENLPRPCANASESHLAPLSKEQAALYGATSLCAQRGLTAPMDEEILSITGLSSFSSPNRLINSLHRRGFIEPLGTFQNGRWLRDLMTGTATAPPRCRNPHWRSRTNLQRTVNSPDNDRHGPGDGA
jgi:hypothetical protein